LASGRTISANGIELFVREEGEGPLVVLWPELSYSWRILLGGRGLSEPTAVMFVKPGKGFL